MPSHSVYDDLGPRSAADGERPSLLSADPSLFVPPYIRAMSDAELIAATRALNRSVGGYAWATVVLATLLAGASLGALAAVIASVVSIAACKVGLHLHERSRAVARGQLAKREFCARYHIGALALDEAAAVTQLAHSDHTQLVVLFRAWALPHGGHRFIRVELGAENRIAMYATPFLGDLQRHAYAQTHMSKLEAPLSAAHAERLRSACADLPGAQLESVPARAIAHGPSLGLPCDLVVLRRNEEILRAGLNLDAASTQASSPLERLARTILDLEAEVTGSGHFTPDLQHPPQRADLVLGSS
jgi:hypothetical protein